MIPTIRPITEDEKPLAEALYRNAFKITTELSQRWTFLTELSTTRAIVEQGRVLSILTIKPFEIWVGGKLMKMGGISGVATWADQQGKGYAGLLVRQAISDMYDMGYPVSILYPFSFAFYGRFGYSLASEYLTYSTSPAGILRSGHDSRYRIRPIDFAADMPALQKFYNELAPKWNSMVRRDQRRWEYWQEYWQADKRQVYLVEQASDGMVVGYFDVMDNPLADGGYESTVTELMFKTDDLYPVLANFLSRLPSNIKKLKLIAPASPRLWDLFKEPSVETRINAAHQVRIVGVALACTQRGYADHVSEEVTFIVQDGCTSWNSGPWQLMVRNGQGHVRPCVPTKTPILTLQIQDFSAIFIGYKKATDLARAEGFAPNLPELEAMDRIFYDRETRLLDHF